MTNLKNKLSTYARSKFLLTGSFIALVIAFSPYLFYLYEIFPNGRVWENSLFTYESKYYEDVMTAAWTFLGKLTPLVLLLIWFFTCKHWWYHSILVPITMYGYQLITAYYQDAYADTYIIDTDQLIYLAPFFIVILSIVYLIRIKIFDRIYGIDLSEIDETDVSVFSPISETDRRQVKSFQEEEEFWEPAEEDYYTQL
ncbi:hypothetical protein SAMN05660776_0308 [Salegentibacter holothuriorum]|uniref:Uncharacterized protein n=1 Tax=Salegentibacter holothuriorum TaxID=241145 RepID=A0A1T5A8Q1_9FLAO|nr:hypothetical protein [Salegentibacter holothuriorum]SKB31300.1 hypothetical protein SAMN05660776_0308 [Salegentibacter holothuriorum]